MKTAVGCGIRECGAQWLRGLRAWDSCTLRKQSWELIAKHASIQRDSNRWGNDWPGSEGIAIERVASDCNGLRVAGIGCVVFKCFFLGCDGLGGIGSLLNCMNSGSVGSS